MTTARRSRRILAGGAALALALAAPAAADDLKVVADGLDNPRGLALGPGGHLYVAESGRGGSGPCVSGPEGDPVCFGLSGAVTRIDLDDREQKRITTGLPSLASPAGTDAIGPSDVSFVRKSRRSWDNRGFLTVGLGADPAVRAQLGPDGARMAQLHRLWPDGRTRALADLGAFEAANDPDGQGPDSNPNSVAAVNGREGVVADAGANAVLLADRLGNIAVLGVIPSGETAAPDIPGGPPPGTPIPFDAVPTSVALGEDGKVFVGQLTGFPFPTGAAGVWVIEPGQEPKPYATGFTLIIDIAWGEDGSLYVLQIASATFLGPPTPGALIRVKPNGEREELVPGELTAPTGLVLDGGYAYVSNRGTEAGTGEVVRIKLHDHGDDDD
jgi:hypothetical protein